MADTDQDWDSTGLRAMFLNGTLNRSPEVFPTTGDTSPLTCARTASDRRHR